MLIIYLCAARNTWPDLRSQNLEKRARWSMELSTELFQVIAGVDFASTCRHSIVKHVLFLWQCCVVDVLWCRPDIGELIFCDAWVTLELSTSEPLDQCWSDLMATLQDGWIRKQLAIIALFGTKLRILMKLETQRQKILQYANASLIMSS